MDNMLFAGIDLHKTQFTVCVLKGNQTIEDNTKYETRAEGYNAFITRMNQISEHNPKQVRLAIESTSNSRYFKEMMEKHGFNVTVVNTLRFKVVNLSTKKTDKNDAKTLAEFLSRDILPQSHLCTAESEGIRRILKSRSLLVQNSVALKNQAHAVLLAYGIITRTAQFQSKKGRDKVLQSLSEDRKKVMSILFDTLEAIEIQQKRLERNLRSITKEDEDIRLLMTIPGVGIVNACTIRAYMDDIDRFLTYKSFSAFCGLVPWVQNSNETVHYGRITKRGPQELRTALVQCVVAMVRMGSKTGNLSIIRQYHLLKEQKSSGKAIIATARKLSRIIYVMLKTKTPFISDRLSDK